MRTGQQRGRRTRRGAAPRRARIHGRGLYAGQPGIVSGRRGRKRGARAPNGVGSGCAIGSEGRTFARSRAGGLRSRRGRSFWNGAVARPFGPGGAGGRGRQRRGTSGRLGRSSFRPPGRLRAADRSLHPGGPDRCLRRRKALPRSAAGARPVRPRRDARHRHPSRDPVPSEDVSLDLRKTRHRGAPAGSRRRTRTREISAGSRSSRDRAGRPARRRWRRAARCARGPVSSLSFVRARSRASVVSALPETMTHGLPDRGGALTADARKGAPVGSRGLRRGRGRPGSRSLCGYRGASREASSHAAAPRLRRGRAQRVRGRSSAILEDGRPRSSSLPIRARRGGFSARRAARFKRIASAPRRVSPNEAGPSCC